MEDMAIIAQGGKSFQIYHEEDMLVLTYQRSWYHPGILFPLCFLSAGYAAPIAYYYKSFQLWMLLSVFTASVLYIVVNAMRKDGWFAISKKTIVINNKIYRKRAITDIYMKAPKGFFKGDVVTRTRIIYNPYNTGSVIAANAHALGTQITDLGTQAHAALSELYVACNYQVGIVVDGKELKLAGGLNEKRADALFAKIEQLIQEF